MKRFTLSFLVFFLCTTICSGFEVIVSNGTPAGTPLHWNSARFPVGYSVHNDGTAGVSSNVVSTIYKQVIKVINSQSPLKFKLDGKTSSVGSFDGRNGVVFDKNFQFGSFVLAIQRYIISSAAPNDFNEGDLIFNDKDYNWTKGATNINNDIYNIFSVMLHEMGHGTGLNHTAVKQAVMFFQYQNDVKKLHPDDEQGIKFIYQNPVSGNLPTLITPIDKTVHTFSTIGQAASVLTFRWESSKSATAIASQSAASTYTLVFAADSGFTKNVTRFNASSKEAFLLKGAKLNKLKKIQAASATKEIFWRVEEKNGTQTLKSGVFSFKIA